MTSGFTHALTQRWGQHYSLMCSAKRDAHKKDGKLCLRKQISKQTHKKSIIELNSKASVVSNKGFGLDLQQIFVLFNSNTTLYYNRKFYAAKSATLRKLVQDCSIRVKQRRIIEYQ